MFFSSPSLIENGSFFFLSFFCYHRYVDFSSVYTRHNFSLYLPTGAPEFAREMLIMLFNWFIHWLFLYGFGST